MVGGAQLGRVAPSTDQVDAGVGDVVMKELSVADRNHPVTGAPDDLRRHGEVAEVVSNIGGPGDFFQGVSSGAVARFPDDAVEEKSGELGGLFSEDGIDHSLGIPTGFGEEITLIEGEREAGAVDENQLLDPFWVGEGVENGEPAAHGVSDQNQGSLPGGAINGQGEELKDRLRSPVEIVEFAVAVAGEVRNEEVMVAKSPGGSVPVAAVTAETVGEDDDRGRGVRVLKTSEIGEATLRVIFDELANPGEAHDPAGVPLSKGKRMAIEGNAKADSQAESTDAGEEKGFLFIFGGHGNIWMEEGEANGGGVFFPGGEICFGGDGLLFRVETKGVSKLRAKWGR